MSSVSSVAQGLQGCKISLFRTLLLGWACCLNKVLRHPAAQKGQQEPMNGLIKATLGTCPSQEIGNSGEEGLLRTYPSWELIQGLQRSPCRAALFCSGATLLCLPLAVGTATSLSYEIFLPQSNSFVILHYRSVYGPASTISGGLSSRNCGFRMEGLSIWGLQKE